MDRDHVEAQSDLVAFIQQDVGFGDAAFRAHVHRIVLIDFRFRIAFADAFGKGFQQEREFADDLPVVEVRAPPVVRQFSGEFAAQGPEPDMRILGGFGLGRLLQFCQIFRRDRAVRIQMEIPHQDPRVVDIFQMPGPGLGIQNEEMFHP